MNNLDCPVRVEVAFFPSLHELQVNPYWSMLANGLVEAGIPVVEVNPRTLVLQWLWRRRRATRVLHLHYIQSHYVVNHKYARLRWVFRFARNLVVARLLGYRVVWTVHDEEPAFPLQPKWVEELAHRVVAFLAHSIIVHCDYAKQVVERRFGRSHGVVIAEHPSFIGIYPDPSVSSITRTHLGIPSNSFVFLCFGQIRPNKGIENLIEAFSSIREKHVVLVIAGVPGPDTSYVNRLRDTTIRDPRILFLDHLIPDDQVAGLFGIADVAVMSFARVLTSASVILAMSLKKPVIVPAMGCLSELITTDTGWVYSPEDPRALGSALVKAIDADIGAIGNRAYERVSRMTLSRTISQTLRAYDVRCRDERS